MKYRGLEEDLKGLVKIFKACFKRNENPIPRYRGQEIGRRAYDYPYSVASDLNGIGYEAHLDQGRELNEILLSLAWKLGFDYCHVAVVEKRDRDYGVIRSLISSSALKSIKKGHDSYESLYSDEGIICGVIDSIITQLRIIRASDLSGIDVRDALRDLRANQDLRDILEIKKDKYGQEYSIENEDWFRKHGNID